MTIDDLPSGIEEVVLTNSQYHPDAIIAIKARHDAAAMKSRTEDDAIVGAIVAKSKVPVVIAAPAAQTEVSAPPSIISESVPSFVPIAVQAPGSVLSIKSAANEIKATVENSSDAPEKGEGVEPVQETVADENISADTIDMGRAGKLRCRHSDGLFCRCCRRKFIFRGIARQSWPRFCCGDREHCTALD